MPSAMDTQLISARESDPEWPIGYPCILVTNLVRDPSNPHGVWQVGMLGYVRAEAANSYNIKVFTREERTGYELVEQECWVPKHAITIGEVRKFGEMECRLLETDVRSSALEIAPLGAAGERVIWTKNTMGGIVELFQRMPVQILQGADKETFTMRCRFSGKNDAYFDFDVPAAVAPPVGQMVYPVIERMINGSAHAAPYALLPGLGVWTDWEAVMKIAVCFEWEDGHGQWRKTYLQSSDTAMRDGAVPGSIGVYADALAIERFVTRQPVIPVVPRQWWEKDLGRIELKEIIVDFLTQTTRLSGVLPMHPPVDGRPIRKPNYVIRQEMIDAGLSGVDGISVGFGPGGRPACDRCYLEDRVDLHNGKPTKERCMISGFGRCGRCQRHGTPCSWTDSHELSSMTRAHHLLLARSPIEKPSWEIEPPQSQLVQTSGE